MKESKKIAIVGTLVSNRVARRGTSAMACYGSKFECLVEDGLGGMIFEAGKAYRLAATQEPWLFAIMGKDPLGEHLSCLLKREFSHSRSIRTSDRTRASCIVPGLPGALQSQQIFTVRCNVNQAATIAAIDEALNDCGMVLLGSMSAADDELVTYILDKVQRQPDGQAYLLLTGSQLENPERAVQLSRKATWIQINHHELEKWTRISGNIVAGINRLREWGLKSVIVTAGEQGAYLYADGWFHQRAFAVMSKGDLGAGDVLAGTVAAGLAADFEAPEAVCLGAAAAAMHVAGLKRLGGWEELRSFAAQTSLLPVRRPRVRIRRGMQLSQRVRAAGYAAAGAAAASLTIMLSAMAFA